MDESLRKKILIAIAIGIIVLCGIIALFLLLRKPPPKTVITKTEYLTTRTGDGSGFLPTLSDAELASVSPALDHTDTSSRRVTKGWNFLVQAIKMPWIITTSLLTPSSLNVSCKTDQSLCNKQEQKIMIIKNEHETKSVSIAQRVLELPLGLYDNLQDLAFYKFIGLLQQAIIANDAYPIQPSPEETGWLGQLVATGEMSQFYYDVFQSTYPTPKLCETKLQEGFCYEGNRKQALLYFRMRAATTECPYGGIKSWESEKNMLKLTCFSESGSL